MVLSRRAIETLLEARLQLARRFSAGEIALWPFCQAFVPTTLKAARGMRFADVSRFADTQHLVFRPQLSLHDPRANRAGSLAHSVLSGQKFIAALLARHPPRDFFSEGSELREGLLSQAPFEDIVEPLRRALARRGDHGAGVVEEKVDHPPGLSLAGGMKSIVVGVRVIVGAPRVAFGIVPVARPGAERTRDRGLAEGDVGGAGDRPAMRGSLLIEQYYVIPRTQSPALAPA